MKNAITLSIALATTLAFSGMALAQVADDLSVAEPANKHEVRKMKHEVKKMKHEAKKMKHKAKKIEHKVNKMSGEVEQLKATRSGNVNPR